ncbi:MAG: cell division protein FtsA [Psychromonas sp.]|nr:cell division protein FtsA [Psychromonas sp.]
MENSYTVGLDIGSSKIVIIIGEEAITGEINVIGVGEVLSCGVDKGAVTDLDAVVGAISKALVIAEEMANCKVSSVNLSLSGAHIKSQNESGTWAVEDHEVTSFDIESVLHNARSIKIQDELRLLHVIPQSYSLDALENIKNPIGLSGVKLKVDVHLIICHNDLARNLEKAAERCGLQVDQLTYSGVASSAAILSEDEKELGVCLVDMGSDTMDISVYISGALLYSIAFNYSAKMVTNDIGIAFSAPMASAEKIKVEFGCLKKELLETDEKIELSSVGGRGKRNIDSGIFVEVIEARYSELLGFVKSELIKLDAKFQNTAVLKQNLAAGIVITGGGAQIRGLIDVAKEIFDNMPIRVGQPTNLRGLVDDVFSPSYSTAVGLLKYKEDEFVDPQGKQKENGFVVFVKNIKNWIKKEY